LKCTNCGDELDKDILNLCPDCLSEGYRRVVVMNDGQPRWKVVKR